MHYSLDDTRQYHTQTNNTDVGRYVILTGDPGRCKNIAKRFRKPVLAAQNREFTTYTGTLEGRKVSVASTGIGGPSTAIAMQELYNCGARTFIRVGTCGGMQREVFSGDIVIATGAIRAEGTSKEYAPIEYPAVADIKVTNALINAAAAQERNYHVGVVQSKDSFYGQHEPEVMPVSYELENKWQAWIRMGALASEMESAAAFIIGGYLRASVGTVLLVMANQEREKMRLANPVVHDVDAAVDVAVEALRLIIKEDKDDRRKKKKV